MKCWIFWVARRRAAARKLKKELRHQTKRPHKIKGKIQNSDGATLLESDELKALSQRSRSRGRITVKQQSEIEQEEDEEIEEEEEELDFASKSKTYLFS